MPCTRQTARKSTGGTAPRKPGGGPVNAAALAVALPAAPALMAVNANPSDEVSIFFVQIILLIVFFQACYRCREGGILTCCSFCPRSVCNSKCLAQALETLPLSTLGKGLFVRPACHFGRKLQGPYCVSNLYKILVYFYSSFFKGFYSQVVPTLIPARGAERGITLPANAFTSRMWREDTAPLLVVHVRSCRH